METILWQLVIDKGCSIEKYLQEVKYPEPGREEGDIYFVTKIMTLRVKRGIIITKVIEGNWYDTIKNIEPLLSHTAKKLDVNLNEYFVIFHGYFHSIKLEQFYTINADSEDRLTKLSLAEFEKFLH